MANMDLCERCARIDPHSLPPALDTTTDAYPLATLSQIFQGAASACPFCRIVMSCIRDLEERVERGTGIRPVAAHADTVIRLRQGFPVRGDGGKLHSIRLLGPGNITAEIPLYAKRG